MLSLPLIVPSYDAGLWPQSGGGRPTAQSHQPADAPAADNAGTNNAMLATPNAAAAALQTHPRQFTSSLQQHTTAGPSAYRYSLAALSADEQLLSQRKANVRNFGAGWIRPPGVPKTYQAMMDEAAEREEQEEVARREMVIAEMAHAAEAEAQARLRARVENGEVAVDEDGNVIEEGEGDEEEGEGERDLDDDVPEAEDVTFNEDSLLEGSVDDEDDEEDVQQMLDLEEAEMTGALQDARDMDHDLDDDVPEAGNYEHTDSEAEDEDEDMSAAEVDMADASHLRLSAAAGSLRQSLGQSLLSDTDLGLESSMHSSFLDGSPSAGMGGSQRAGPTGDSFASRLLSRRPNGR